jgi:hypothetical protein
MKAKNALTILAEKRERQNHLEYLGSDRKKILKLIFINCFVIV